MGGILALSTLLNPKAPPALAFAVLSVAIVFSGERLTTSKWPPTGRILLAFCIASSALGAWTWSNALLDFYDQLSGQFSLDSRVLVHSTVRFLVLMCLGYGLGRVVGGRQWQAGCACMCGRSGDHVCRRD
jgi:hypothetical protein